MIKVMIADDQELIRESLKIVLSTHVDIDVVDTASDGLINVSTSFSSTLIV